MELQQRVQAAIDRLVSTGAEGALQVAVFHQGDLVVDATSGTATADSLFFAASTAKGIASSVAHVLVERGELDYDLPAVDVWPELGAHGKDDVTLRQVLLHTAGVPAPPYDTSVEDLCDWDHMCSVLAAAEPWWEPGTRFGYHAQTFGFLLGEIVRRATGRTLSWWLREAITVPLGVADDVHFGVPPALLGRVVRAEPAPNPVPEPGSPADRALPPGIRPDADFANRTDVLTSDIPSFGTMTARGAARIYAVLLSGELVSPGRLREMAAVAFEGTDEVMGIPSTWAFGFSPFPRPGSSFGMVGMNGSAAYADVGSGLAVAVMRARFGGPDALAAVGEVDRLAATAFPP